MKLHLWFDTLNALMIIQTVVSVILINSGSTIHIVKLVGALIFLIHPIFIYTFVRKKYNIDKNVLPDNSSIKQRWDAFAHQVANFVNNNTSLVILVIFSTTKEVSVYTVYFLVYNGIILLIGSSAQSLEAAFGNMFVKGENETVKKYLKLYEFLLHSISIILYTCMALLITSFVGLYVSGVDDVNYNRPLFGYIISIVGFFFATRIPYEDVTRAAGHYKETRNGAILEALINIIISIILVFPLGIIGIAIGSLVAMIFRTIQYGYYSSKHLLSRPLSEILKRYVVSAITILLGLIIILFIPMQNPVNFFEWILNGFITAGVMIFITLLSSIIFYREELINLKTLINRLLKLRPKNGIKNN